MEITEFRERLFDALNEADSLPIKDIETRKETIIVVLEDESRFEINCTRR